MREIVPCNETNQDIVQLIFVKKHTKKRKTATELGGLKEGRVSIPESPRTSVNKKEEDRELFFLKIITV